MKRFGFLLAFASVVTLALPANAFAAHPYTASHGDPFASCVGVGVSKPPLPTAINYPNTEVEPMVADNPVFAPNVIGAWQQDRWNDGGAKGLVAGWSFNGGKSWGQTPLPFSECAAAFYHGQVVHYLRTSDPWVSLGPDGRAYAVSISFNENDNNNDVAAATSTDGGRTWGNLNEVIKDVASDPTAPFNDKESVTADPRIPGTAYAVWDRGVTVPCSVAGAARQLETRSRPHSAVEARRAAAAPTQTCSFGPAWFSRTTNGGRSWEKSRPIVDVTTPNEQTIGNIIVVNHRNGTLYDFYTYITADNRHWAEMVYSTDGGAHWSGRQRIAALNTAADSRPSGVVDPRTGEDLRTGDILPEPAIDPNSGQLYLVWQDAAFNGGKNDQVVISTSRDPFGRPGTWTAPKLVSPPGDPAAFTPAITVNRWGGVAISFYDLRHLDGAPNEILPTDTWVRISEGGGLEFEREVHLSGPFNIKDVPNAGGFFTGDYEGLTASAWTGVYIPFWSQSNCADTSCKAQANPTGAPVTEPDPMDIYASRISPFVGFGAAAAEESGR